MFDGVPDQFHQFITPTATTRTTSPSSSSSLPLHLHHHLPFPTTLHPNTNNTTLTFPTPFAADPYNNNPSHHHQFHQVQHNLLHPAAPLHSSSSSKLEEKEESINNNTNNTSLPMNFGIEIDLHHHQRQHQHQQLPELIDPWSNEEVLTLLRIRSGMESWFPELTWEHVSRKMAEVGYKRSAEKCKEKFEEESRFFTNNMNSNNNNNNNYGKSSSSYQFLSELEELCHHQEVVFENDKNHHQNNNPSDEGRQQQEEEKVKNIENRALEGEGKEKNSGLRGEVNAAPAIKTKEKENEEKTDNNNNGKRKRGGGGGRFEMFKGFCESIVHKMMEQQEEMHNRLIEDMVRWDEEKFARDEAWKRQEIERMNKELEIMAQEQAIAGDRQASIIDFLKKFAPEIQGLSIIAGDGSHSGRDKLVKVTTNVNGSNTNSTAVVASELHSHDQNPNPSTMESSLHPENSSGVIVPNPTSVVAKENPSSSVTQPAQDTLLLQASKNPISSPSLINNDPNPMETNLVSNKAISDRIIVSITKTTTEKDDIGRRWPKDEVLALINLRSTTQNNNNNEDHNNSKEGNNNNKTTPLWERISQGMMELGYKRSAKRCKEKWENINKYFRKTKDINKKRSLDSRTCPYFHHLSSLYSQGKLALHPSPPQIPSEPPADDQREENHHHGNNVVVIDNNDKQNNQTQLADETTTSSQVGSGDDCGAFSVQQVDHGGEKTLDFDQF